MMSSNEPSEAIVGMAADFNEFLRDYGVALRENSVCQR